MEIGEKIRRRRRELDITQAELSKRIGISISSLSTWEQSKAKPRKSSLQKLNEALGCDLENYIPGSGDVPNPEADEFETLLYNINESDHDSRIIYKICALLDNISDDDIRLIELYCKGRLHHSE